MEDTTPQPTSTEDFKIDAETRQDAESLDYKSCTLTDPAHKLQSKAGAIAGMVGGTALGTIVAGPVGAVIGAVVGGITGGIGGKIAGEMFDPSAETEYWMKHHADQPFAASGSYIDFEPAYRTGYNNYTPGETFEQAEADLKLYYKENSGQHHLDWEAAKPAARAAWQRLSYIFPPEKFNTP